MTGSRTKPSTRSSIKPPTAEMITVLIVEDDPVQVRTFKRLLDGHVKLFICDTAQQGRVIFDTCQHAIDIIFLDGNVHRGTTEELLRHIRSVNFKGRVISITSDKALRSSMAPPPNGEPAPIDDRPKCDRHIPKDQLYGFVVGYLTKREL